MAKWWERLREGVAQANAPRVPDVDPVDNEPRAGRRPRTETAGGAVPSADRFPVTPPPVDAPLVHMNAEEVLAQGDVIAPGPRMVRQPEPGRHAWVIAIWYTVDPLELQDGGRFSLLPDQVIGTLPPQCYFCDQPWSFQAMRVRCPGRAPGERW